MQTVTSSAFRAGALALALATATVAIPASAWPGEESGPEHMLGKMARYLDLSEEQQASVAELMAEAREAGVADRVRMREIKTQLRAQSSNFDASAARTLADELGEITARSTYRMTETRAAVHALLGEEQRSKLEAMEAQRGEHGRKHGKGSAERAEKQERRGTEASDS